MNHPHNTSLTLVGRFLLAVISAIMVVVGLVIVAFDQAIIPFCSWCADLYRVFYHSLCSNGEYCDPDDFAD